MYVSSSVICIQLQAGTNSNSTTRARIRLISLWVKLQVTDPPEVYIPKIWINNTKS